MPNSRFALHGLAPHKVIHGLCAFLASNSRFMRLLQGALDTPLDSPFSATLSVHGLHFTVCAPSMWGHLGNVRPKSLLSYSFVASKHWCWSMDGSLTRIAFSGILFGNAPTLRKRQPAEKTGSARMRLCRLQLKASCLQ